MKPLDVEINPPKSSPVDLLIISGEHSGDEIAAKCVAGLFKSKKDINIVCIGGPKLRNEGADLIFNLVDHSVVGFVDVIRNYKFFKTIFNATIEWIEKYKPRHICFVDFPGFNLRLAEQLYLKKLSKKGGGNIGLHYYVSPQIWSWKSKRRFKMDCYLNSLACLFPFEKKYYEDTSLDVSYVGHPFADDDYNPPVKYDKNGPLLILPGSRINAVKRLAPIIFNAFFELYNDFKKLEGLVIYPSNKIKILLEDILKDFPDIKDRVKLTKNDGVVSARAAIMSSGTMSLNMALASVPGVVIYALSPINYYLIQLLGKIKFIGLANLILEREIYTELLQGKAKPKKIAQAVKPYLFDYQSLHSFTEASQLIKDKLTNERDLSVDKWLRSKLKIL